MSWLADPDCPVFEVDGITYDHPDAVGRGVDTVRPMFQVMPADDDTTGCHTHCAMCHNLEDGQWVE